MVVMATRLEMSFKWIITPIVISDIFIHSICFFGIAKA
jgi:hypothetical protein